MTARFIVCLAAMGLLAAVARAAPKPAETQECPIEELTHEAREKVIRSAPSCDQALELFGLCSTQSTQDIPLGAIVRERCEARFLSRLTPAQRRAYEQGQKRCARKYRHEWGTMYRSFEALCGAQLAQTYARRFSKGKTVRPAAGQ